MNQVLSTAMNAPLVANTRRELAAVTVIAKKYTNSDAEWLEALRALGIKK